MYISSSCAKKNEGLHVGFFSCVIVDVNGKNLGLLGAPPPQQHHHHLTILHRTHADQNDFAVFACMCLQLMQMFAPGS